MTADELAELKENLSTLIGNYYNIVSSEFAPHDYGYVEHYKDKAEALAQLDELCKQAQNVFTQEQIRSAYWKKSHKAGELWYDYLGTEEECQSATESGWEDFMEALNEIAGAKG